MTRSRTFTAVIVALIASSTIAWSAPTISGVVTDTMDRALPGTVIALYSSIGPFPFLTTTGSSGEFDFPDLVPATYYLVASREGYAEFIHSAITVVGSEDIRVHINLTPAPYSESVRVEEQLDSGISDDPREAEAFSSNLLEVLPLPTDRFQEALPLLPGVVLWRTPQASRARSSVGNRHDVGSAREELHSLRRCSWGRSRPHEIPRPNET